MEDPQVSQLGRALAQAIRSKDLPGVEIALHKLWCHVLNNDEIPDDEETNFFAVGGESAHVARMVRIAQNAGVKMTQHLIFTRNELRDLAKQILSPSSISISKTLSSAAKSTLDATKFKKSFVEYCAQKCFTTVDNIEDVAPLPAAQTNMVSNIADLQSCTDSLKLTINWDIVVGDDVTPTGEDNDLLQNSWHAVCRRNPSLRSTLVVHPEHGVLLVVFKEPILFWGPDWRSTDPHSLPEHPLIRQAIFEENGSKQFKVTIHPILADFWSRNLIFDDFRVCLQSIEAFQLLPARPSHAHFVRHINKPQERDWGSIYVESLRLQEGGIKLSQWSTPEDLPRPTKSIMYRAVTKTAISTASLPVTFKAVADAAWVIALMRVDDVGQVMVHTSSSGRLLDIPGFDPATTPGYCATTCFGLPQVGPNWTVMQFLRHTQERQVWLVEGNLGHRGTVTAEDHSGNEVTKKIVLHSFFNMIDLSHCTLRPKLEAGNGRFCLKMTQTDSLGPIYDYRHVHAYLRQIVTRVDDSLTIEVRVAEGDKTCSDADALRMAREWEEIVDDMLGKRSKTIGELLNKGRPGGHPATAPEPRRVSRAPADRITIIDSFSDSD